MEKFPVTGRIEEQPPCSIKINAARTGIDSVFEFYTNKYGRMRDVCISPEGKVYVCTDNGSDDKIIEVSKSS